MFWRALESADVDGNVIQAEPLNVLEFIVMPKKPVEGSDTRLSCDNTDEKVETEPKTLKIADEQYKKALQIQRLTGQ